MGFSMGFGTACIAGLIFGAAVGGCVVVVVDGHDDGWASSSFTSDAGSRPKLGVHTAEPTRTTAAQARVDQDNVTVITDIVRNSPAERAGLQKYDIIAAIDGSEEADPSDLRRALRQKQWGDMIALRVVRAGEPLEVLVPLENVERTDRPTPSY
ncbi:MAG: PDZ domain-containing protein [Planctomycetota bacterium]|nr:PDZ domain-containing protein [Planctomycetota bacterium]